MIEYRVQKKGLLVKHGGLGLTVALMSEESEVEGAGGESEARELGRLLVARYDETAGDWEVYKARSEPHYIARWGSFSVNQNWIVNALPKYFWGFG